MKRLGAEVQDEENQTSSRCVMLLQSTNQCRGARTLSDIAVRLLYHPRIDYCFKTAYPEEFNSSYSLPRSFSSH